MEDNVNNKPCRYCRNEMKNEAIVCSSCGKNQNWFWEHVSVTNSISFFVLLLAIVQLVVATMERSKAEDAFNNALEAKNEVLRIQEAVKQSENRIKEIGLSVVNIAEILPRSTGYGAGLSEKDKKILDRYINLIKKYSMSYQQ